MLSKPIAARPELLDLIEKSKQIPITLEMRAAQRRSWVTAGIMFADPDMTKAEANRRYDEMLECLGYAEPRRQLDDRGESG